MTSLRQRMTEDMQVRNLAPNTQTSYVRQVSLFARHFNKSPVQLGPEDIRAYQVSDPDLADKDVPSNPTETNPNGLAGLPSNDVLIADAAGKRLASVVKGVVRRL